MTTENATALLDSIADGQMIDETQDAEPEVTEIEAAPESAPAETLEPETAEAPETDPEQSAAPVEDGARAPHYIPPVREDAAAQLAQIEAEIKALGLKLDNGDIETDAYHESLIKLTDARTQIQIERAIAEQAAQAARYSEKNAWDTATQRFLSANPDYQDMTRQEPLAAIARMVMAEESSQHKSPDWVLSEAKRRLESAFGLQPAASDPAPAAPRTEADIKAAAKAKAAALKPSAPISISDIPGTPGAAATEFERLDQAGTGFSKIDALMSLPPEKLEAWMNRRI
jgi:hypothetical protein